MVELLLEILEWKSTRKRRVEHFFVPFSSEPLFALAGPSALLAQSCRTGMAPDYSGLEFISESKVTL